MRWLRSLYVQLFLWALMPVTLVVIAFSFTGVYSHQQAMRDFAVERDAALARFLAQIAEDGLAQGAVTGDGGNLSEWMALDQVTLRGTAMVVDGAGRVLAHVQPVQVGADARDQPGTAQALSERQGSTIAGDGRQATLVTYAPVAGTGWTVVIREPVQELLGPLLRFPALVPGIAGGAGVLSLLILLFGWRTIVRPLRGLARAAEGVTWGDYGSIAGPVHGVQEVRDLHRALADMVERIRGYEAGMRDYLGAVTHGQETERARLARDLHDGPVQALIALGQRAEMAQRLLGRGQTEQALAQLEDLRRTEQTTVQDLRRLIGDLRPIYLEDLGFAPALEMLVREYAGRTSAEIRLDLAAGVRRLPPEVELAAFRVAQEALNNAVQHAQARTIVLSARCDADDLVLSIVDDGAGFALPDQPSALTGSGHFGLLGMQERATQLGGTLRVQTAPGQGTRVVAHLPSAPPAP